MPFSSMKQTNEPSIFTLDIHFKDPIRKSLFPFVKDPLEYLLSLDKLNRLYYDARNRQDGEASATFMEALLSELNVRFEVSDSDLKRIPKTGPLVVVANHPFGAIEGIILAQILASVRQDVKIMANYMLERIPDLRKYFIFVDPFGGSEAARANISSMRLSIDHVKNGGVLGIFPAGEVAHLNLRKGEVTDPEWSESVGRIIRKTEAAVVPIFFAGFNSPLFQLLGMMHPRLRTAMLPYETMNKKDRCIQIRIGNPIAQKKLALKTDDKELITYLRDRTYLLQNREDKTHDQRSVFWAKARKEELAPVATARPLEDIIDEIESINEHLLLENSSYAVYCSPSAGIPNILHEIGRLREISFRQTHEGTGKPLDLDEFDNWYEHLFVWNKAKKELVGAYRLGRTDVIFKERKKRGLYTYTLFNYKSKLVKQINPALEMGRSFIRPEYQRSFSPLMLLWKGIGHYVVKNPEYKILFGPVSINNEYQSFSRKLMVAFLEMNRFSRNLAKLVKARVPFRSRAIKGLSESTKTNIIKNLDDVNDLIADVESTQKGVPILLKQYLNLGGQLLGFNVDPDFADVLDGLILVDLTQTEPRILRRYMGDEGTRSFLTFHKINLDEN